MIYDELVVPREFGVRTSIDLQGEGFEIQFFLLKKRREFHGHREDVYFSLSKDGGVVWSSLLVYGINNLRGLGKFFLPIKIEDLATLKSSVGISERSFLNSDFKFLTRVLG